MLSPPAPSAGGPSMGWGGLGDTNTFIDININIDIHIIIKMNNICGGGGPRPGI